MNDNSPKGMSEFQQAALNAYNANIQEGTDEIQENLDTPVDYNDSPISDVLGAPTWGDIDLWKAQYPDSDVLRTSILGKLYVFRTLVRVEYKQIVARKELNQLTREEVICSTCCLWPQMTAEYIGRSSAGTCSALSKLIMELSGFTEPEMVERLV